MMAKRFDGSTEGRAPIERCQGLEMRRGLALASMARLGPSQRAYSSISICGSRYQSRPVERFSFSSAYGRNRFGSFQPIRASRYGASTDGAFVSSWAP